MDHAIADSHFFVTISHTVMSRHQIHQGAQYRSIHPLTDRRSPSELLVLFWHEESGWTQGFLRVPSITLEA
jgi:hypothetical protein